MARIPNRCRSVGVLLIELIIVVFVVGCAKNRLPLTEEGLEEFIYKVADVGYEFDYELIDYRKQTFGSLESKASGNSKGVHEYFILKISREDHINIMERVRDRQGWSRVDITLKPLGEFPRIYGCRRSRTFQNEGMSSRTTIPENDQIIEILWVEYAAFS